MVLLPFPSEEQNKLLTALIALARATEGNEHLLTESTDRALAEGVLALAEGDPLFTIQQVEAERARIVPDCFRCAAPCEKSIPYDVQNLLTNPDGVLGKKAELLLALQTLFKTKPEATLAGEYRFLFCQALFSLGRDDWEEVFYQSILSDVNAAL
ncbi:MAG: hypothetical protein IJF34_08760 [Clostridia bacterium]|nr:hypothetical protein [Clostridia bacterium]